MLVTYAQETTPVIDSFFYALNAKIINPLIEIAFFVAFLVFMWGVFQFIRGAGDPTKRKEGKDHMMWGILGFVIMFGVYAIINILARTFGFPGVTVNNKEQRIEIPKSGMQVPRTGN